VSKSTLLGSNVEFELASAMTIEFGSRADIL
jgi:hypothetical protein